MLSRGLLITALVGGATGQSASTITPTTCQNLVMNGNFEADGHTGGRGYYYVVPGGWNQVPASPTRTVAITQGNRPWGGLRSGSGRFYYALQGIGTGLNQTINNLVVGGQYTLRFKSAERPGYGSAERITVSIGGIPIIAGINPLPAFRTHEVTFTATATSMVLLFQNTAAPNSGDTTGFIDDVSICAQPPSCVGINNPNFEVQAHGTNFLYTAPGGWTASGATVLALNGNGPWGGLNSGNGAYYLVLQRRGAQVWQLMNLTSGTQYTLSFLAAERPGYTVSERLGVLLNGNYLPNAAAINVFPTFVQHTLTFTAGAVNNITFRNTATSTADTAVFLDAISICALPPPPPPSTTTATTTTTPVTDTFVILNINQARTDINNALQRIQALENMLAGYNGLSTLVNQMSTQQVATTGRITAITAAISAAISVLPPASPRTNTGNGMGMGNGNGNGNNNGNPSITRTSSGNLLLNGGQGAVQAEGSCGVFDLCNVMNALEGLRNVPV